MAQFVLQNAVDLARELLNDQDNTNYRYTDAQLTNWCNQGLNEIRRLRPDLFIGQYLTYAGDYSLTLTSPFPIDNRYLPTLGDYLVFRAEMRNDEAVLAGRSMLAEGFFEKRLLT